MEASVKKWGLVTGLLAVLVISLVIFRILTSLPGTEHGEVLSTSDDLKQNGTKISQDEVMSRLHQMENRPNKKRFQGNGLKTTSRSEDIELLQHQIDILTQQVSELTKAIAESGNYNSSQRKDDLHLLQSAVNDPVMRQKYQQFQEDLSINQYELIDEAFQREMVDDTWAIESEDTIKTNFYKNDSLAASNLVSVDCRTSICRLTVTMPKPDINNSEDAAEHFVRENELLASISKDLPGASIRSQPDGEGGLKYQIFLFREGYEQPKLQSPLEGKRMSEMIEYVERY